MKKYLLRLTLAMLLLALLLMATFAIPLHTWRTGEVPAMPLSLSAGDSFKVPAKRIWVDTDAACGSARKADVDDCFALLLLAGDPHIRLAGISTVYGNASLEVSDRTTHELVSVLKWHTPTPPPVFRGSAGPLDDAVKTAENPAMTSLRAALKQGPLTIVALGPLTNIAASLQDHPRLQVNVASLVAVMGHRPGHLFHPAEGKGKSHFLFGHGPIFTDFNFAQDRHAVRLLMEMHLPITFVSYDAARGITITATDLERMQLAGGAARWISERSKDWIAYWNSDIGLDGFYPFDLVAAAFVIESSRFSCAKTAMWLAPEPIFSWLYAPDSLLLGVEREKHEDAHDSGEAIYCPRVDEGLHRWLMNRLTQ